MDIAAIEGGYTTAELSSLKDSGSKIQQWKRRLLEEGGIVFAPRTQTEVRNGPDFGT
ncbi:MAG: hypothetical protein OXC80_08865 [Gammaproteobacteria bacterium]|nr:hypothetical protein [Gammaproteobacteria bacterium]